jgi:hypothetical protein
MSDIDLDSPDLTALALGEADGERLDRALEFLIRSEEARAMAAETLKLGERLSAAFGREPGAGLSESLRTQVLRTARRQVWTRRLKRAGLTVAICGLTAAATLAGAAVLPPDGRAAELRNRGRTAGKASAPTTTAGGAKESPSSTPASSAGLELGLPVAAAGDAGGFYRLSLSADAVQAAADKNWKFAFGPEGEATFGPEGEAVAQAEEPAAESSGTGLDEQISKRLEKLGIASGDVDDETYYRRLHLDARGTPPPPDDLKAFVEDPSLNKRAAAAGRLLAGGGDEHTRWYAGGRFRFVDQYAEGGGAPGATAPQTTVPYSVIPTETEGIVTLREQQDLGLGDIRFTDPNHAMYSAMGASSSTPTYPAEVQSLVDELDAHEAEVRKQIERWLRGEKFQILDRLRGLQDGYTRADRLDDAIAVRALVQKLEGELLEVQPDPGWLTSYRGRTGETLYFRVTGNPAAGTVWGSDVYTDDSVLAAAAVHAGVLKPGETGMVKVTILPGQSSYTAAARNGVMSNSYGEWRGSYRVERFDWKSAASPVGDPRLDASGHLDQSLRGRIGETFVVEVTGNANGGPVWGSDVYTDDSAVPTAAVHAGVLKPGETGPVKIAILGGRDSYAGSERNGVQSLDYHSWGGSFRIERAETPKPTMTIDVAAVADDPGNLMAHVTRVGGTHLFRVTGDVDGAVWGTDVYTSDSDLSTAAVHAGVLKPREAGVVKATILEGRSSYSGSDRNGVTSGNWQEWNASYRLERVDFASAGDPRGATASAGGKYRRLLMTIDAPDDVKNYGKFRDFGHWEGTSYLGHENLPPAYWVYVAPRWYLWAETTQVPLVREIQPDAAGGTLAPADGPRRTDPAPAFRGEEIDTFLGGRVEETGEPAPTTEAPAPAIDALAPATDTLEPAIDELTPRRDTLEPAIDTLTTATGTLEPAIDAPEAEPTVAPATSAEPQPEGSTP